jgi:hypothetical protein
MRQITVSLTGLVLAACLGGCTSYYKVTDPHSNKVYYTTDLKQNDSGSTTLKDARTGNMVTVQNSEVEKINKEEFQSGKQTPPSTMPG